MRKVPLPESDSDHMHRCAMCAMLLTQPPDPRDDYSADAQRFHPDKVKAESWWVWCHAVGIVCCLKGSLAARCDVSFVPSLTFITF